jgi:type IV secretion system protein VirB9
MKSKIWIAAALLVSLHRLGYPESAPQGTWMDNRVRVLSFNENQIYKLIAYYGYQTDIELAPNEEIRTVAAGDTVGWQIVSAGQHLFIKPMANNARTNLSVITNRRTYVFDLIAQPVTDRWDMTYLVRFKYPQSNIFVAAGPPAGSGNPTEFNFNYKIRGSRSVRPSRVFDDGQFTYFQFENPHDLPAIFWVGPDGKESLVNYRMDGPYVVVERVGYEFLLRSGGNQAKVSNQTRKEPS